MTNEEIHQLAQRLRIDSIRAAAAASSGHPTSSMSAADLMAVLMARHLRYDYDNPWHGDFVFVAWVHDEVQIAVRDGLQEKVGAIVTECAVKAGEPYGFRIPLASDYKVGLTWADTH